MTPPGTGTEAIPAPPADGSGPPPAPAPAPAPGTPPAGPRKLRALIIGCVIAVALAVFLFVGLGTSSNSGSGTGSGSGPVVGVGDLAPGFSLPSLTGGAAVSLDALGPNRHHPVVLNFFASWCIPCQKETPLLARTAAAEQAKGSPVQFIGVDVADKTSDALAFVHQSGITYPVGTDTELRVTSVLYGLNGEPNTFFIDASGHVLGHVIGAVSAVQLTQWLHRLAGARG
jgi:cytochrome c biogenesis protein CcmG, thiol:disulfide interchange protein DsbE